MFRKHPLRDFMLFLVLGITITFAFNVRAVDTDQNKQQLSAKPAQLKLF